jgi:hypothetical protein
MFAAVHEREGGYESHTLHRLVKIFLSSGATGTATPRTLLILPDWPTGVFVCVRVCVCVCFLNCGLLSACARSDCWPHYPECLHDCHL